MFLTRVLQPVHNFLRTKLFALNVFDSQSTDPVVIRREIHSTRLFLILLASSIFILTLYTSLSVQIKRETVQLPTYTVYKKILRQHSDTIQCPCEKISVPYGRFVSIQSSFHQVCSSDYVSQLWIDLTFRANATFIWPMDVRTSLSAMWQLIAAFCRSSISTFNDTLNEFNEQPLISSIALSEDLLRIKVQSALYSARQTASDTIIRSLTAVHQITHADKLTTGLGTNCAVFTYLTGAGNAFSGPPTDPIVYRLQGSKIFCSCHQNSSCPLPGNYYLYNTWSTYGIYDLNTIIPNGTLPGIIINCYPTQTMIASSLECFYNQSCMNILFSVYSKSIDISILNESLPSRFSPTTNIETLIRELFIEQIFNETMHDLYYSQCAPVYCTYTSSRRFDWTFVITTLIALSGGLTTIFRLITPHLIDLIYFLTKKKRVTIVPQQNENIPIPTRLKNLFSKIQKSIIELNLFVKNPSDPINIRRGRLTTRLYIILLIVSITILLTYTFLSIVLTTKTIHSPSQEQYEDLYQQYSDTLQCPCTTVSIPYNELIEVIPTYHELCESGFIQPDWYENLIPSGLVTPVDFRVAASAHFQMLATLCQVANLTILEAIRHFSAIEFVNAQVLPRNLYLAETKTLIDTFLNSTRAEFRYTISLISTVLHANQYVSCMATNALLFITNVYASFGIPVKNPYRAIIMPQKVVDNNGVPCSCFRNATCNISKNYAASTYWSLKTVPGVYAGCFIMDSVLKSSFICLYNTSCVNDIKTTFQYSDMPSVKNITAFDVTQTFPFIPSTPIETILDEIMIVAWNSSASYIAFYEKCRPAYCTFTYYEKYSVIYMVTSIIAILGGLNIVLRWISLIVVKIFFGCTNTNNADNVSLSRNNLQPENRQRHHILNRTWTRFRQTLVELNLFDSRSVDIRTIQREYLLTRLYLIFLFISVLIVVIYTILLTEITSRTISTPSEVQYKELNTLHSDTLQCPCTHISVPYERFIKLNNTFHQVCTSDFVKEPWFDFLYDDGIVYSKERPDIRVRGAAYFDLLSTLCTISQTAVNNAIDQFLAQQLTSAQVISQAEFSSQMEVILHQFEIETPTRFSNALQLLRDITHGNTFVSSYSLNWYWEARGVAADWILSTTPVMLQNGCSCGTRSDCVESGGIYYSFNGTQYFPMSGWNVGCSVVETVLRSTLECLYNRTCLDLLQLSAKTIRIKINTAINVTAMNSTLKSRFQANTSIVDIVSALFVEEWQPNISYSAFYQDCAPSYCSYSFEERNSLLFIISRILGLYGGLTASLRFIVPLVMRLWFRIKARLCLNTVTPLA